MLEQFEIVARMPYVLTHARTNKSAAAFVEL